MKFLIIGLGSMGKRRIRNLRYLGIDDIIGFDTDDEKCRQVTDMHEIKTFDKIDKAMAEKPDALIISTPPHLHHEYAMMAAEMGIHFFTELNILSDNLNKVVEVAKKNNIIAAASCDMRYIASIKRIKEFIEKGVVGDIVAFTYHSGQYLPDWHPWENYRKSFFSRKETSGTREIIAEELNWLPWVFGKITSVFCMKGKFSHLEADIDDVYQILMKFEDKFIGSLLVDVVSRIPYRQLKIIGGEGVITWDGNEKTVKVFSLDKKWKEYKEEIGTVENGYIHKEEPYIEEMEYFIAAIKGEVECFYTLEENIRMMKIMEAIEVSADAGTYMRLKGVDWIA